MTFTSKLVGSIEMSCWAVRLALILVLILVVGSVRGQQGAGPDITVCFLHKPSAGSYGSEGDIAAFAFGTTSTNIGDQDVSWFQLTNEHPVIGQNVFRLKDDRFEQIGQSWLAHGFAALAQNQCGACQNPNNTSLLGPGCSTPEAWSINGWQGLLGPKWEVNAHTGGFPYPFTDPGLTGAAIERRVQIRHEDIDLSLNQGALYFVEAHYVTADDAIAGNGDNNASWHRAVFLPGDTIPFEVQMISEPSNPEQPAIMAWKDPDGSGPNPPDPDVLITEVRVPAEGLFYLGAKSWQLPDGFWAYEYAVQNLNSHRSAGSFHVPLPTNHLVRNVGFHDVDYHSGEPFDGTDWPVTIDANQLTWATTPYDENLTDEENIANALRWGTLYNFRFETTSPPDSTQVTLGLYRPGFPLEVTASTTGPSLDMLDCNANAIDDACDIDCGAPGCATPCGDSLDCDGNTIPDECQADCNGNDIADTCDLIDGTSQDCNQNTAPDECEPDCDGDGIIDDCDPPTDCDMDGVEDCQDLCRCSSGVGACVCPPEGDCCFPKKGFCFGPYPWQQCILDGGIPECAGSPCVNGCEDHEMGLDCNENGIVDWQDILDQTSTDCDFNGVPDECEPDCNSNQITDACEPDGDGDGTIDACDGCPGDPDKVAPGVCGCGVADIDSENDGFEDCIDNCPNHINYDQADCDGDGLGDVCALATGISRDCNNDVIPDECSNVTFPTAPIPAFPANRFLTVAAISTSLPMAIRVVPMSVPAGFESLLGTQMWLGLPVEVSENSGATNPLDAPFFTTSWISRLECDPVTLDGPNYPRIYVWGDLVVPGATYAVQTILDGCDTADEANFSEPLLLSTSGWGDLVSNCTTFPCGAPDGAVNITTDVTAVLDKFKNEPTGPAKYRCDLEPNVLDLLVNISDVTFALDAFRGDGYPFTIPSPPCP